MVLYFEILQEVYSKSGCCLEGNVILNIIIVFEIKISVGVFITLLNGPARVPYLIQCLVKILENFF